MGHPDWYLSSTLPPCHYGNRANVVGKWSRDLRPINWEIATGQRDAAAGKTSQSAGADYRKNFVEEDDDTFATERNKFALWFAYEF